MEVASPLAFAPAPAGKKRSLSCSPQRMDSPSLNLSEMEVGDDGLRSAKRRRFHAESAVESLSEHFSSHSPFFSGSLHSKKGIFSNTNVPLLKRQRSSSSSPVQEDLKRVVEEQAAVIESLKEEKSKLESTVTDLKTDHDRAIKENQLLRKAVSIQQERQNQAESQLKAAQEYREGAEDQIRKLEQLIVSLRYHLQAQQPNVGNDFMGMPPRPPDVF